MFEDDPLSDAALIKAARRRLLAELDPAARREAAIINNVYGSGSPSGGVMDHLAGSAAGGDDPFDYFVDITRKDLETNPETGKPVGWEKTVHRHRKKKVK